MDSSGRSGELPGSKGRVAGCEEPRQAVQAESQSRLEGDVRATILGIGGGGVSGSKDESAVWATQLASQEAIDNQWYLYYLCVEYEAGRIPKGYYCALTGKVWERITGFAVPVETCLGEAGGGAPATAPGLAPSLAGAASASAAISAEKSATASTDSVIATAQFEASPSSRGGKCRQRPSPTNRQASRRPGSSLPRSSKQNQPRPGQVTSGAETRAKATARFGRWSMAIPGTVTMDLYGPYEVSGTETLYPGQWTGLLVGDRAPDQQMDGAHASRGRVYGLDPT
jgi:hypothetical protein